MEARCKSDMEVKKVFINIGNKLKTFKAFLKRFHLNGDISATKNINQSVGQEETPESDTLNNIVDVQSGESNNTHNNLNTFAMDETATKKETSADHSEDVSIVQSSINYAQSEDKDSLLNSTDLRVLHLLSSGHYSVVDITKTLSIPDPRSNIRYLRKAGYNISDYWQKSRFSRYKVYFYYDWIDKLLDDSEL